MDQPGDVRTSRTLLNDFSMITPAPRAFPDLRRRAAFAEPEPQVAASTNLQALSQSAQQAIQQASDAVRQASQQASQSIQAASQSASNAIAQAQNSAAQSISAASRSVASAQSVAASANAAESDARSSLSSISLSAVQAVSLANAKASSAVVEAGAAIAAATGSAAAAGSSLLLAASRATQSAAAVAQEHRSNRPAFKFNNQEQALFAEFLQFLSKRVLVIPASSIGLANFQQAQAVSATQVALAVVASVLFTIILGIIAFCLISRHRKKAESRKVEGRSPESQVYPPDSKLVVSNEVTSIISSEAPPSREEVAAGSQTHTSATFFSLFPSSTTGDLPVVEAAKSQRIVDTAKRNSLKTTKVKWNPSKPPKAPILLKLPKLQGPVSKPPTPNGWQTAQETGLPVGAISLPPERNSNFPLGGQLKSPLHTGTSKPAGPPLRSPKIPVLLPPLLQPPSLQPIGLRPYSMGPPSPVPNISLPADPPISRKPIKTIQDPPSPRKPIDPFEDQPVSPAATRRSTGSGWTDVVPESVRSPPVPSLHTIQYSPVSRPVSMDSKSQFVFSDAPTQAEQKVAMNIGDWFTAQEQREKVEMQRATNWLKEKDLNQQPLPSADARSSMAEFGWVPPRVR